MKKAIFTNKIMSSKSLYLSMSINWDVLESNIINNLVIFVFTVCLFGGIILVLNIAEGNITWIGVAILLFFAGVLYGMFRIRDNYKKQVVDQKWEEVFSH